MKKYLVLALALLVGVGPAFGDVQIDRGQAKSSAPIKFFVARYARTGAVATAGAFQISADSVVIWDSTSNDGVSVQTSTTSADGLAIGITMDAIPGSSRDNSSTNDEAYGNWGRVQCWGRYDEARWAAGMFPNGVAPGAGSRVATSATAQAAGVYLDLAPSGTAEDGASNTSRDHFGVLLEAAAAGDSAIDIFINRC